MTIAIDYDKTWASPLYELLWAFADLADSKGHRVICVARRSGWSEDMECYPFPPPMRLIYAGPDQLKEDAARKAGYKVDIWIDDEPGTSQKCRAPEPCADSDL